MLNRTIVVLSALSGTTNALVEISNSLSSGDREAAKQKIDKHSKRITGNLSWNF
jgi:aspartate kinase